MDFLETINSIAPFLLIFIAFLAAVRLLSLQSTRFLQKIAAAKGWSAPALFEIRAERAGLKMTYGRTPRKYAASYHYFSAETAAGFSPLGIYSPNPQEGSRKFGIRCDESIRGKITSLMESDQDMAYFTSKNVGIELSVGKFDLLRVGNDFKLSIPTGDQRRMELRIVPPLFGPGGLPEMKNGQENEYGEMVEHGFAFLEKIAKIAGIEGA